MVPRNEPRPPPPSRLLSTVSKYSILSYSSSFQADDERSSSPDVEIMGPDASSAGRLDLRYDGEDSRPTSRKELAGWYAYSFAGEVFVLCGMGSFIPIALEQLARENGVLLSDHTTPCGSKHLKTPSLMSYYATDLMSRVTTSTKPKDTGQCVINIWGVEINTASFAMYAFSVSVLLQSLLVISISCAADHGNYRKRLLLLFAWTGAVATMLFLPIVPGVYLLGALLAIIANVCFGASWVLLNSFLPLLVRHHPDVQQQLDNDYSNPIRGGGEDSGDSSDTETPIINSTTPLVARPGGTQDLSKPTSVELQVSTQISAAGIGVGYSAGLFVQCILIVMLILMKSTTFSLRLALFLIGLWWFVFTIPAAMWLRPRPGPPLPSVDATGSSRSWLGYLIHSWSSLFRTISLTPSLPDILLFLLAWFLLSDAIATVSGVAILFAKTQLQMSAAALAMISLTVTISGIIGAFAWPLISKFFNLKPLNTILICIFLFEIIPLYGLAGYLPFVQRWQAGGLQQPWEMYPLAFLYGIVLGCLSSYCRSLFGELIPPGSEAAFYALYAITDKGSSIFGPAIVGIIVDRTGEIRPAFWFLLALVGLPAPLLWFVDVERGREAAKRLAEMVEGFKVGGSEEAEEEEGLGYGTGRRPARGAGAGVFTGERNGLGNNGLLATTTDEEGD